MMINLSNCHIRGGKLHIVYERPEDLDGLAMVGNVFDGVDIKTTYRGEEHDGLWIVPHGRSTWWGRVRRFLTAGRAQW